MRKRPTILEQHQQLWQEKDRLTEVDYELEPVAEGQLNRFLLRIRSTWDHEPMPDEVGRIGDALRQRGCTTCGGASVIPFWVGEFIKWSDASMPSYGTDKGWKQIPCTRRSSVAGSDGGDCSATPQERPVDGDAVCNLCGGDGLLPEWAAISIDTGKPVWLSKHQFEGMYWFPYHCCACGGWGRVASPAIANVSSLTPSSSPPPTGSPAPEPSATTVPAPTLQPYWRRNKETAVWEIYWKKERKIPDTQRGMEIIAKLLAQSGEWIHACDLDDLRVMEPNHGLDVIDEQAAKAYRNRIETLAEEIEAETDPQRRMELQDEVEQLEGALRKGIGLGGRPRRTGDGVKKARTRQSIAIKRAIESLRESHPDLAGYLDDRISCGNELRFVPRDGEVWDVEL